MWSVGNKIGGGLVSALLTGLLTMAGYISSTAVILVLYSWKLDKIYPQIVSDLAERASRGEM